MSSAGIYNYRPKVEHPDKVFLQMTSGGFQPPFYFGGAQSPTALGFSTSSPTPVSYDFTSDKMAGMGLGKRGIQQTTHEKNTKIMLPRNYKIR
jgi:hypothetical protein